MSDLVTPEKYCEFGKNEVEVRNCRCESHECAKAEECKARYRFPNKEELEAHLRDLSTPPTMTQFDDGIELMVKGDKQNARLIFFTMLSALTSEPMNTLLMGESSTGKTWLQQSIADLFPTEEELPRRERFMMTKSYSSPTSFYHEMGSYNKETKERTIECFPKIFNFLDMPNKALLDRMKTLLSHDDKQLVFTYTDPNHRAQTVIMRGWPALTYSTTDLKLSDELSTRCWLATPSTNLNKITQALRLVALREKDPVRYREILDADPNRQKIRQWVQQLIQKARLEGPLEVKIHDEQEILNKFKQLLKENPHNRTPRDLARFFALVKTIAVFHGRDVSQSSDVYEAFETVNGIIECNLKGIIPAVWKFYHEVVLPAYKDAMANLDESVDLSRQQIRDKYRQIYGETLDKNRYDAYTEALHGKGLVELVPDPNHRGWNLVRPLESSTLRPLVTPQELEENEPSTLTRFAAQTNSKDECDTKPLRVLKVFETLSPYTDQTTNSPTSPEVAPSHVSLAGEKIPPRNLSSVKPADSMRLIRWDARIILGWNMVFRLP